MAVTAMSIHKEMGSIALSDKRYNELVNMGELTPVKDVISVLLRVKHKTMTIDEAIDQFYKIEKRG